MKRYILFILAAAFAAGTGFFTAAALSGSTALVPQKTVTVNVGTGATGPAGPAGPPGASISIKGSVATPGDLPTSGNQPGDTYIVNSDGSFRTWDGTKFVSSGPVGAGNECPTGSTFGKLVINAPGGQVSIYTCIVD